MTVIKIKRSTVLSRFGSSLKPGELAYSFVSKKLYIGNPEIGEAALEVGNTTNNAGTEEAEIRIIIE